eukprot:13181-Heterococcus_DN1.PRE.1
MVSQMSAQAASGLHGTGSRFMPVVQIDEDEHYPRSIAVAGMYPGITAELRVAMLCTAFSAQEIAAVTSSEAAEPGSWQYDFTDPEGPQMGTVAVPGSAIVTEMDDPCIIVAQSDALGIVLPQDDVTEVLVCVDRASTEFLVGRFFVWQQQQTGEVTIRWFDQMPADHTILGQVMTVHVPFLDTMEKQNKSWMEEESY